MIQMKKVIICGHILVFCLLCMAIAVVWADDARIEQIVSADRIKNIRISGAFPVYQKDIRNIMTVWVGDIFQKDTVDNQADRIISLLKKQGYIDPKVNIAAEQDQADGHYSLSVHIKKGAFLKIVDVQIEGNQHVSSTNLKLKLKSVQLFSFLTGGTRLVKTQIDSDIKRIIQVYRKKGFADVQVVSRIKETHNYPDVAVVFSITEGPLYRFSFNGNAALKDALLKKEIVVFKEGNAHGFGIKKTIRNIKSLYKTHGYADVSVTSQISDTLKDTLQERQMTFFIDEGRQYIVSQLTVKGNHSIDTREITRQILTGTPRMFGKPVYDKKILAEDLNAVRILYLNHGYTQAQVENSVKFSELPGEKGDTIKNAVIEINIDEGPQTRIGDVRFQGLVSLTRDQAMDMIFLKPGTLYREYMIASDENVLKAAISEQGYPHIGIHTQVNIRQNETVADLVFNIDPGPFVTVGKISYTGNFRTSSSVLENEMTLKPDDRLSLTRLLESRRKLLDMQALDSAQITALGVKEKSSQVDLVVEVQERKPYYIELGAGYDTRRHLYAQTVLGDHNFLGRNLNIENTLELSQIGYNTSFSLYEPKFMGYGISSSTRIFAEKKEEFNKDFGIRTYGLSQELFKSFFSNQLTTSLGASYRSQEQYITDATVLENQEFEAFEKRDVVVFSSSAVFRTTDSFVQPKKGMLSTIDIEMSNGFDNDLDDFVKYHLDTRYYFTPVDRLTLALRGRYGLIQPYGSTADVAEDQLFFLGGTSTVRGFDENMLRYDQTGFAVGGKQIVLGNVEARFGIHSNMEFTVFYDIGSVSRAAEYSGSDDFRSSVGCGIRYMTPIGPIGLLYGYKLDRQPGESNSSFHFSMGYTF
ncbi:MAG: outer membrane protein assembly factor BamA [Proteobacteria bacterium]|nr:outer membrane protein assembly factor BamA [Pseudomonadota bacterium]MBU1389800.1 outer membrane protein assembly factor BamA [Pseudomonadota bacterium]MBU1543809.1 outer membrane protein assembly factor BamA [Pseudomonadota bacterium]MBU2482750.1 outer membrane protein assembly factor BamA [Pseudomonadota bacterium]